MVLLMKMCKIFIGKLYNMSEEIKYSDNTLNFKTADEFLKEVNLNDDV